MHGSEPGRQPRQDPRAEQPTEATPEQSASDGHFTYWLMLLLVIGIIVAVPAGVIALLAFIWSSALLITAACTLYAGAMFIIGYWSWSATQDRPNPTIGQLLLPMAVCGVLSAVIVFLIDSPAAWRGFGIGIGVQLLVLLILRLTFGADDKPGMYH